ncbi:MAG: transposase [Thermoplasmata archaeon]|nr:transposase [Thermoplasmata archaeon]
MMLSYKFRLYPNKEIEKKLEEQLEICRWLYNRLLEEINNARKEGRKITQRDTQALIVKLKEENPELKKVYSKVLQMVNYQLWSNMRALSRLKKNRKKIGKLRFKKRERWKSLNFNQSGFSIDVKNNRISLSKMGSVKAKIHREIDGKVKGIWIKKYPSGKWYAIVQIEKEIERKEKTGKVVAIDVGIEKFLVDSDGRTVEYPKFIDKTIERIKRTQKELSRKKKGSKNYEKYRKRLAKLYDKLNNQRRDFLHKLSRYYANNYDGIYVEDLNIWRLVRKGKANTLHRHILDASWGEFMRMLSYKAEGAGKAVVKVSPCNTSKRCARCEAIVDMKLSDRVFRCPVCGWTVDRDYNASLNILKAGLGRPAVPVEREPLLQTISYKDVVLGQILSMKQEAPCVSEGWFTWVKCLGV